MSRSIFWVFDAINYKICSLFPVLHIGYLRKKGVKIGEGTVFFGTPVIDITTPCLVEIGKNCILTHNVSIIAHGYDVHVLHKRYGEWLNSAAKVAIEDNVFIGLGSIILKGVTIGKNTIIGAGSVVAHDIPPNSVAVGNPCNVIMTLDDYYEKMKVKSEKESKEYQIEIRRAKKN